MIFLETPFPGTNDSHGFITEENSDWYKLNRFYQICLKNAWDGPMVFIFRNSWNVMKSNMFMWSQINNNVYGTTENGSYARHLTIFAGNDNNASGGGQFFLIVFTWHPNYGRDIRWSIYKK